MSRDSFFRKLTGLAVPILLQSMVAASLNLVDNLMIGQLGEVSIAAVGLANQVYFLMMLLMTGICGGASIFLSQYWGKKDLDSIHKTTGIALIMTVFVGAVFTVGATVFPGYALGIFSADPLVIEAGADYITIAALSYIPFAISCVYSSVFRSTGRTKIPLLISSIAIIINTVLNYLLISGNFGFPELGVRGAAIATLIARLVGMVFIILIAYLGKNNIGAKLKEMFEFSNEFFRKLIRKIAVVVLNDGVWGISVLCYSVIFARMGTSYIASVTITAVILNMMFLFARCIGSGISIMVGNSLGADNFDQAKTYARKGIVTAAISGAVVALGMLALRDGILSLYNVNKEVLDYSRSVLNLMMIIMPVIFVEFTTLHGALRAGGDIVFSTVFNLVSVYGLGLPLAFLGAFVFKLPFPYVYLLGRSETIVRAIAYFVRYKMYVWVKNVT